VFRVLHLSDLHFGQLTAEQLQKQKPGHTKCTHKFVGSDGRSDPLTLAGILKRDPELHGGPDIVIVTGDIGWTGVADDYVEARAFFNALQNQWAKSPLVVIPGNHDVDRNAPTARQTAFLKFVRELHGDQFNKAYPLLNDDSDRTLIVSFQEHTLPAKDGRSAETMLVVGVNSAAALEDKSLPIEVAASALARIEELLRSRPRGEFRIFALHHHLLPFTEPRSSDPADMERADPTIVGNSARLQSWLAKHDFSLVLHGHRHKFHGRSDTLWRKSDPQSGRTVLIAGAGSAGVFDDEREQSEPLSYNVIHATRLSLRRWNVDACVQEISHNDIPVTASTQFRYSAEVGPRQSGGLYLFEAEYMDDCHRAIQRRTQKLGWFPTFVSIVDTCEYRHPSTAVLDEAPVDASEVMRSFKALHPEHALTENWTELGAVDSILKAMPQRYQFQHGPRMFGTPHGHPSLLSEEINRRLLLRPIMRALDQLKTASNAHAYVSLYRPEVDVLSSGDEPFPSLMSLQFLKKDDRLDLVATFRKIELSFWWVVNMYEAIRLLEWAAGDGSEAVRGARYKPGSITFFAALAEWKKEPAPSFTAKLDEMDLGALTCVALSAVKDTGIGTVIELLEEKESRTNAQNLDSGGLQRFAQILGAVIGQAIIAVPPQLRPACDKIANAAQQIETAIDRPADAARRSAASLREAIALLKQA